MDEVDDRRRWVPELYTDEVSPVPRDSPNDWVERLPGDGALYRLAPAYEDEERGIIYLISGDKIDFLWFVDHGTADFTINPDGTWTVDPLPPAEVTIFMEAGNPDSLALNLNEFARGMVDNNGPCAAPETTTVRYGQWSDTAVQFWFEAGAFVEAASNG